MERLGTERCRERRFSEEPHGTELKGQCLFFQELDRLPLSTPESSTLVRVLTRKLSLQTVARKTDSEECRDQKSKRKLFPHEPTGSDEPLHGPITEGRTGGFWNVPDARWCVP